MSVSHMCSFSSLDEIPRRRRGNHDEVLRVLHKVGKFSTFEVDASLGSALDWLKREKLIETDNSIGYPWTSVKLTDAGLKRVGAKPDITTLPASVFRSTYDPPDTTLIKSTRPATCAVCRQDVTASIVLPSDEAVCEWCVGVALRNMIDDAAGGRGPVRT